MKKTDGSLSCDTEDTGCLSTGCLSLNVHKEATFFREAFELPGTGVLRGCRPPLASQEWQLTLIGAPEFSGEGAP